MNFIIIIDVFIQVRLSVRKITQKVPKR